MRYTVPRQIVGTGGTAMRIYQRKAVQEEKIARVICNQCGKALAVTEGIVREGCFHVEYEFDYFSKKDGHVYSLDLCEDCFDTWVKGFREPVQVEETREYL